MTTLLDVPSRRRSDAAFPNGSRDERLTLEERLERAWRGLHGDGAAECPLCDGGMTLHAGAGECRACGARLT